MSVLKMLHVVLQNHEDDGCTTVLSNVEVQPKFCQGHRLKITAAHAESLNAKAPSKSCLWLRLPCDYAEHFYTWRAFQNAYSCLTRCSSTDL